MTTVYVVTAGSYSDYHVEGVFSTMELALEFTDKDWDRNDPQEWELDADPKPVSNVRYYTAILSSTGEIKHNTSTFATEEPVEPNGQVINSGTYAFGGHVWLQAMSTISQEHADKLAVEARQAWLRQQDAAALTAVVHSGIPIHNVLPEGEVITIEELARRMTAARQ